MSRFLSRTALTHLRLAGPLAFAATLSIGSLPALAQSAPMMAPTGCSAIHFDLANPGPGSRVEQGTAVVTGVATDMRATNGAGVDRVDFFLDSRDAGGAFIGTAAPGTVPGPFGPGSFQTTVSYPNTVGGHDLFAYAHSAVTGQESIIDEPIAVGEDPSKAGESSSAMATQTCTGGGNVATTTAPTTTAPMTTPAMTTAPMATTPATTTAATTTAMMTPGSTITLDVGNPSAGDTVHVGGMNISGVAWDKAAMTGSGIDRIDVFLDNRDAGGILLTEATLGMGNNWQATPILPSNQTGLHSLVFYAHSAVTGKETSVTVPVTIAP